MRGGVPIGGTTRGVVMTIWTRLKGWFQADGGVTSIEYALVAALIAVVIVGAVATVGSELNATYDYVSNCVKNLSCQA